VRPKIPNTVAMMTQPVEYATAALA
jgi:hypothetical protein